MQRSKTDRPAPAAAQLPNAAAREMTLFTLNLHHDREDWPGRRAYDDALTSPKSSSDWRRM
ncbi:endonuclease-exonuclease-phosphatase family protein [Xanthomonas oryzae pv. oryzicola BLS256]|uniref:Endonuclease-exonuclease-phosphatase family protein n=1 Tax=Xanthomonas oryzae pv. oryzicola (strain BLS256) TaxID=383407 RepID=G7TI99_XANOB|nr:endonuclease-exonuclease-phosphatase family protein [Xanthomonas oryzae pv. oryzicola BLS256]